MKKRKSKRAVRLRKRGGDAKKKEGKWGELLYKKFKINDEREVKRVVVKTAEPD